MLIMTIGNIATFTTTTTKKKKQQLLSQITLQILTHNYKHIHISFGSRASLASFRYMVFSTKQKNSNLALWYFDFL